MDITGITVIGAGTMGADIAAVALLAGVDVKLIDVSDDLIARGRARIEKGFEKKVGKGALSDEERQAALGRLSTATDAAQAEGQLVIEAVPEMLDVKRSIFKTVSAALPEETIIGSNTSSLPISQVAAGCPAPERILGIHFFNPATVMKLVELIRTESTSEETLDRAGRFVEKLGKETVVVRESYGFIVNRLLIPMINEAALLYAEGVASAEDIDKAMKLGTGHPMGPLALADMIGLDVCAAIMQTLEQGFDSKKYETAPIIRQMVDAGKLGRKTGAGFHEYKG